MIAQGVLDLAAKGRVRIHHVPQRVDLHLGLHGDGEPGVTSSPARLSTRPAPGAPQPAGRQRLARPRRNRLRRPDRARPARRARRTGRRRRATLVASLATARPSATAPCTTPSTCCSCPWQPTCTPAPPPSRRIHRQRPHQRRPRRPVGRWLDRHGGRLLMTAGSAAGVLLLLGLVASRHALAALPRVDRHRRSQRRQPLRSRVRCRHRRHQHRTTATAFSVQAPPCSYRSSARTPAARSAPSSARRRHHRQTRPARRTLRHTPSRHLAGILVVPMTLARAAAPLALAAPARPHRQLPSNVHRDGRVLRTRRSSNRSSNRGRRHPGAGARRQDGRWRRDQGTNLRHGVKATKMSKVQSHQVIALINAAAGAGLSLARGHQKELRRPTGRVDCRSDVPPTPTSAVLTCDLSEATCCGWVDSVWPPAR